MSRQITNIPTNTPSLTLAALPVLSAPLSTIVKAETVPAYGGDAGTSGGADFRRATWRKPCWLPPVLREEAERLAPAYETLAASASLEEVSSFLMMLFGCTRKAADQDWNVIGRTYAAVMREMPRWCFRKSNVTLAAAKFTWFPAMAELFDFFEEDMLFIGNHAQRLRYLAGLPTEQPSKARARAQQQPQPADEPWKRPTPEQREEVAAILSRLKEQLGRPTFRASLRPEDDRGFEALAARAPRFQVSGVPGTPTPKHEPEPRRAAPEAPDMEDEPYC